MKRGIDVMVRYHEFKAPIAVAVNLTEFDDVLNVIDYNVMRSSDGVVMLVTTNTPLDQVKRILAERELYAKLLVREIMKALERLDTDNGYPLHNAARAKEKQDEHE